VKGPTQFIPKASEWTHEFKWHGRIPENKTKYKAGELQFTVECYYNRHFFWPYLVNKFQKVAISPVFSVPI